MLSLKPLQRALERLYRSGVAHAVDDFVRPMPENEPERARREVVLVGEPECDDGPVEIALMLDPDVARALAGATVPGLTRFAAWCLAVEGVSHFQLLAFRADNDRPVSQLELELQAEVDKFAIALLERVAFLPPAEASAVSGRLRRALFGSPHFHDPPETVRGTRYRLAHRLAARYAASLEQRFVRQGRLGSLVDELREFYRAGMTDKHEMARAA